MTSGGNIIPYTAPATAPSLWRGVQIHDLDTALRISKIIAASGLLPRSFYENNNDPVACCFVAIQLGGEIGMSPMCAVQNIAVINGRPALYGPAQLAVVEASGKLAAIEERIEGEGDDRVAVCTVQRVGRPPKTIRFGVRDAQRAGLWDKRGRNGAPGPWQQYPERMLQARARSFALRDVFPDVLLGLGVSAEEIADGLDPATPVEPPPELSGGSGSRANRESPEPKKTEPPKAADPVGTARTMVKLPGGDLQWVERTWEGANLALDIVEMHAPGAVALNNDLLDRIAARIPELADRVSAIRTAAAQALAPATAEPPADADEPFWPDDRPAYDTETGELLDPVTRQMAVRRGGVPTDDDSTLPPD
jgi:hypothetical protein